MNYSCFIQKLEFPQKEIPPWSANVERWYQLDAYAFGLCEAFTQFSVKDFTHMVLSSPDVSNETDYHFAHAASPSPQKFVHTLPNVRASVALQALGKKAQLMCLQNAPLSLSSGLEEFDHQCLEGKSSLFASIFPLSYDYSLQSPKSYGVFILTRDKNGDWAWTKESNSNAMLVDCDFQAELFSDSNKKQLGPWVLEKVK